MRVQFWGTRASVPTPDPSTVHYGGSTSCVEVRTAAGTLLVVDCGTALRELGRSLQQDESGPVTGHFFVSHTHWDHIQGFPFFGPLLTPHNNFTLYGPRQPNVSLKTIMAGQMNHAYFPVGLVDLGATIDFCEMDDHAYAIDDATVRSHAVNHTTQCLGYRIEADGLSVVYLTDTKPFVSYDHSVRHTTSTGDAGPHIPANLIGLSDARDVRLGEFAAGADLLIMDAQYSDDEYEAKRGWDHCHLDYVVDFAIAAGMKRLALFHHDPEHADDVVAAFEAYCQARPGRPAPTSTSLRRWKACAYRCRP